MAKSNRLHISQNQKTKKRKPITQFANINTPLYQDATTKIIKVLNQPIWHVYKNGKFDMAMYSAKDNDSGEQDSIINNIGKALNPKLRNLLTKYHNIPIDINKTKYFDVGFLYSKEKITRIPAKSDNDKKETILKSCASRFRFIPKNTCNDISVNENYKMKSTNAKDQIYYYIDSLLLWPCDMSPCYLLSGKQHVLIIEDYLRTKYHELPIIGELYDGAHNRKNDMCDKLQEYIKQGKLTQEFLLDLLQKNISSPISLSTLTVFKMGLTFYEKMGYMCVGSKEKSSDLTYYKLFNAFCDTILRRTERVFMPITDYINSYNKKGTTHAYKKLKDEFALIKLILHELLPATKFTLETLQDLYKLIDINVYSVDFFCLNQDNTPKAVLLYYILRVNVQYILLDTIEDLTEYDTHSYKHLQLEPTAENKFILAQHSLIPGIGKEYMGIMLPGPITGSISPKKQNEINDKVTKVLRCLEKLTGKQQ
jgi:hypothetical protein